MFDSKNKTVLRRRLLQWFDQHQRDLPWRKNKTPYRIWVSEIMLQQTQVATVIDYYRRFLKRFSSIKKLADADEAEVLRLWEGLGYYRRAKQMHRAAQVVVDEHGGRFPTDFDQVLALPGIGRYTAGAILSISRDQRLPILEGNTIRLFARLMGLKTDPRSSANQKQLWKFSESLLPKTRVGDFNQALMELGSEICTPNNPRCDECPLMTICPTFLNSWQSEIPAEGKKMQYEDLHEAVVLVRKRNQFLVRQCGNGERWAGLWDFPRFCIQATGKGTDQQAASSVSKMLVDQFGIRASVQPTDHTIKHAVTRYRIRLDCFLGDFESGRLNRDAKVQKWMTQAEIEKLPLSATGRKIAKRFL